MQIVYGLFKPSRYLELAVAVLNQMGYSGEGLLLTSLDSFLPPRQKILDSMFSADGMSLLDGMTLSATVGMLMGVIYGSVLPMGPIALGLLGMLGGGGAGYLIDRSIVKKRKRNTFSANSLTLLSVKCSSREEAAEVKKILAEHHCSAIGTSK